MKETLGFDLVSLGELLIDFTESGVSEQGQRLFEQNPGGATANMTSAVARLGKKSAFIGKVGADMHGAFLLETLNNVGVSTQGMISSPDVFTTLAFVALSGGERSFSFARKPGADTCLEAAEVDTGLLENTRVFHVGSLSMTDEPARSATMFAVRHAREHGAIISYDPNYRDTLWQSEEMAQTHMRSLLPMVDIIKISDEETRLLTGRQSPEDAAMHLCAQGIRCVAVTLGREGALVCVNNTCRRVEGFDIPATDTTGAGDAFWGGFMYQYLCSGVDLDALTLDQAAGFARFGNATATLCVTRRGGIPAMPSLAEVEELIAQYR